MRTQSNEKRALMLANHDAAYILEPLVDRLMGFRGYFPAGRQHEYRGPRTLGFYGSWCYHPASNAASTEEEAANVNKVSDRNRKGSRKNVVWALSP